MEQSDHLHIMFVDSWVRAADRTFGLLSRELEKHGWSSLLVHRGSWEHDPDRPVEEELNGLLCRDFKYYRTRLIYRILKQERPKVVVMLTTNYLFDRAVVLAARALGIKTCFLMHGIRSVTDETVSIQKTVKSSTLRSKRWRNACGRCQQSCRLI